MNEVVADLLEMIHAAFKDVPYPGDDNITVAPSEMYVREYQDIAEPFLGKDPQSITVEFALENHEALSFFTPSAFQFYLPGFMRVVLLHPDLHVIDVLPETLQFVLSLRTESSLQAYFYEQIKLLTTEQKRAIADFLESYSTLFVGWDEFEEENTIATACQFCREL
jgi:hypothetical protein